MARRPKADLVGQFDQGQRQVWREIRLADILGTSDRNRAETQVQRGLTLGSVLAFVKRDVCAIEENRVC